MISEEHLEELENVMEEASANTAALSEWERSFVEDFSVKLEQYGIKIHISPRQQQVIDRIAKKVI